MKFLKELNENVISKIWLTISLATLEDLKNDILKVTDLQEKLMRERRPLLGSKNNQDQMDSFRLTMQIMKYEEFISNTEKQIRIMK